MAILLLLACGTGVDDYRELKRIASTDGFKPYSSNPVISMGPEGSFDAGALGSMTILKVGDTFHVYYEAWGVRSEKEWDASEYETLQIGHATSKDGIHWNKDPENPVIEQGTEGEWDETGVWDPYVIYEDGIFKMWYGGGGGRKPNIGWAYAESKDGTHFVKRGLIGSNNRSGVEDVHVVHDDESGLYYLYYWHGHEGGEDLFCVTSPTATGFDFSESVIIDIEGDDSFWCKFGHVLKNNEGWHMLYSNYIPPHGRKSIVRYASSEDGIHWHAKNKRLIYGLDADVLQVTDDLYVMAFAPENHFDKKDADIRIAVYNGTLLELAGKSSLLEETKPAAIAGKKFRIQLEDDPPLTAYFKPDGEVILSESSDDVEDPWTFNAYYEQNGETVRIWGEGFRLTGRYEGEKLEVIYKERDE
jgi:predicted GH43/DUF377 family glycosyl hydrolase